MTVYMMISEDKFRLPVFVADNPHELATICGVDPSGVYRGIRRPEGLSKYIKVEVEDEDQT